MAGIRCENALPNSAAGGTQEEIIFGFSPELAPILLVCDSLRDEEVLIATGARRIAVHTGYGLDLKISAPVASQKANRFLLFPAPILHPSNLPLE